MMLYHLNGIILLGPWAYVNRDAFAEGRVLMYSTILYPPANKGGKIIVRNKLARPYDPVHWASRSNH